MKQEFNALRELLFICMVATISTSSFAQETSTEEHKKESLKAYVGEYNFDSKADFGFDVTISYDEERGLQAQPTDKSQPLATLMAVEKDQFELLQTGGLFATFKRNDKGEIISLVMSNGDRSFTCVKK